MYKNKILYGFSNIKVAKDGKTYEIKGAVSVRVNLSVETATATNSKNTYTFSRIKEVTGEMEVLGLTPQEKSILFGYRLENNELIISEDFHLQEVELSFEQRNFDNKVITYKMFVTFEPGSIEANTIQESIETSTSTLNFTVIKKNGVYYSQIEKD